MRRRRLIGLGSLGAGVALITVVMTQSGNNPFMELANSVMPAPEQQVADHGIIGAATTGGEARQLAQVRPAAPGPSPEDEALRKLPPAARPENLRPSSKAELEQHCMQNPKCRENLEQIKQGRPSAPRPAATAPSPEDQELKKLPPPAQVPPPRPRSEVIPRTSDGLFSWLNPFGAAIAEAQTAFSIILTPQQGYVTTPPSYLYIYGGTRIYNGSQSLGGGFSSSSSYTGRAPYAYFTTQLPAQGNYLIDVAAGAGLVKLRDGPTQAVEDWDTRATASTACLGGICHYVTVAPYAAGYHYWYFWAEEWGPYLYSVTIQSYP